MNAHGNDGARWALAGAVLVIVAVSVALIWQGSLAAGMALLALAIAVSGPLVRQPGDRSGKGAD
ncbi:hypothetical protein [Thermaurantiacus sp.]